MMKSVEVVARTVDEAIAEALETLEATLEQVEITVIEEGNKGLFGLLGSKQARIKVVKRANHEAKMEAALEFLEELFEKMDIQATIAGSSDEEAVVLKVDGDDLGILIGRRGQTLDSLQYLTSLAVNRNRGEWLRVRVDVGNYRAKREETLRSLAQRLAGKAEATGRQVTLDPMSPAERRIIHQELQDWAGIETHSEGQDPYRRVIIFPK